MDKRFNIHDWQAKQRLAEDYKGNELEVVDTDNRDSQYTVLHLSNGDYVEVNVINLYQNLLDNQEEKDIDEMSTTGTGASFNAGSGAAYATPNAFKKKRKNDLNEVSYSDFKRNTESSPRQKIARGISQVNKMIKEIEKIVSHNFRLKTELDMNSGTFLQSTNKKVHEIGARLKQLENKLREFSN